MRIKMGTKKTISKMTEVNALEIGSSQTEKQKKKKFEIFLVRFTAYSLNISLYRFLKIK